MAGDGEPISEAEALRRLRQSDDPSPQYYAAWWLGRMRSRHPETVPLLRSALPSGSPRKLGSGWSTMPWPAMPPGPSASSADATGHSRSACRPSRMTTTVCGKPPPGPSGSCGPSAAGAAPEPPAGQRARGGRSHRSDSPRLQEPCEAMLEALGDDRCGRAARC